MLKSAANNGLTTKSFSLSAAIIIAESHLLFMSLINRREDAVWLRFATALRSRRLATKRSPSIKINDWRSPFDSFTQLSLSPRSDRPDGLALPGVGDSDGGRISWAATEARTAAFFAHGRLGRRWLDRARD